MSKLQILGDNVPILLGFATTYARSMFSLIWFTFSVYPFDWGCSLELLLKVDSNFLRTFVQKLLVNFEYDTLGC